MITNHKYEPDIRIRREAEGLVSAGHGVHVACRGQYDSQPTGELNGVEITRICANSKVIHNIAERIYAATWYQPVWLLKLREILEGESYDVIYYHDIEHAKLSTKLADWYDLSIVADLHEMYPQAVELWRESLSLTSRLDLKVFLTPKWRLQRLEQSAVNTADILITVSEEILNYFKRQYNFEGISGVVRNVPDLERLDQMGVEDLDYENSFVISYIGGFTPQRGIETAIEAMPELLRSIPDAKLLLVGDGDDDYVSSLRGLCSELGVSDSVEFTGWVDFELIRSYYSASDVTLIPYPSHPASDYALPNKLFQAMAFETPVIVNNLPTMSRIVHETGAGVVFGDNRTLHEALSKLWDDEERRQEMGERGRKVVETKYNITEELFTLKGLMSSVESLDCVEMSH
jgi:glycosyltransferase involved in cell wall biosynthesis